MFEHDYELMPRTYSIKSYKRRQSINYKKAFKFIFYAFIVIAVLLISVLSALYYI